MDKYPLVILLNICFCVPHNRIVICPSLSCCPLYYMPASQSFILSVHPCLPPFSSHGLCNILISTEVSRCLTTLTVSLSLSLSPPPPLALSFLSFWLTPLGLFLYLPSLSLSLSLSPTLYVLNAVRLNVYIYSESQKTQGKRYITSRDLTIYHTFSLDMYIIVLHDKLVNLLVSSFKGLWL